MKRAYVGNIPFDTTEAQLREWFEPLLVRAVEIVHERGTGRPRGFAFVEFPTEEGLDCAIAEWSGKKLGGRVILVNDATPKKRGRL